MCFSVLYRLVLNASLFSLLSVSHVATIDLTCLFPPACLMTPLRTTDYDFWITSNKTHADFMHLYPASHHMLQHLPFIRWHLLLGIFSRNTSEYTMAKSAESRNISYVKV